MSDRLVKFMAHVDMAKITCIDSTELVETARKIHMLNPTPTAALGRMLTMTAMMGAMLKEDGEKISSQIIGDGPVKTILAVSDNKARVKGYVGEPLAEAEHIRDGKLNVAGIIGNGHLNIIKDIGLKEPYVGNVELQTGEIAEDFAYYYAVSEQIPTAVALGVLIDKDGSVKRAGGYIIQILPDTPEEIIKLIENRIASSKSITEMLESNMSLEEIATYISDDLNTRVVEEIIPKYECDCSKDRMERALLSIGKKDLAEIAQEGKAELVCHFCNKKYELVVKEKDGEFIVE